MARHPVSTLNVIPAAALVLVLGLPDAGLRAGAVDNRNNNSADFIRSLSRNAATTGADIAIYNPAGTARMSDGLHASAHNQLLSKHNLQTLTNPDATFEQSVLTPFLPTAFVVYRRDAWAAFGGFSYAGGGGETEYERGSATVYPLQASLFARNPPLNAKVEADNIYPTATVGGAYGVKDWLSLSLGARWVYARLEATVDGGAGFAPLGSSKLVDHMEEAWGWSGIVGIDVFPWEHLVLALRFEGRTPLEFEVKRSTLNLDEVLPDSAARNQFIAGLRRTLRAPGSSFRRDLPANLGLGAAYTFLSSLRTDFSFNYYFQTLADWEGRENLHEDGWEVSLGLEYQTPIPLLLSAGIMYTVTGADPDSYQIENPALDSYTLGAGGRVKLPLLLSLSFGIAANLARSDEVTFGALPTTAKLEKQIYVYALGLTYGRF